MEKDKENLIPFNFEKLNLLKQKPQFDINKQKKTATLNTLPHSLILIEI